MATARWGKLVRWARTARSWRLPVTVLLGFREDVGAWTPQDKIMALALQEYEDSIHHSCGVPASIAFGDDNVERVEWKETMCHACASKESALNENKNRYPGQMWYPTWDAEER